MSGKAKTILTAAGFFLAGMLAMTFQQWRMSQLRDDITAMQKSHAALQARMITITPKPTGGDVTLAELVKEGGRNQVDVLRDTLNYVNSLKPGEIGGALDSLKKMPDTYSTRLLKDMLLARWGGENPTVALAWVKAKDTHYDGGFNESFGDYSTLFTAWAAKDPAAAMAGLKQVNDADTRSWVGAEVLGSMSLTNPQGAMELLHQMPAGQQSTYALGSIFRNWAVMDPTAASTAALNLPATEARNEALASITGEWAEQDPEAALAFANSLPPGSTRENAVEYMMWSAKQDPTLIANTIAAWPNDSSRNQAITYMAFTWAEQDPVRRPCLGRQYRHRADLRRGRAECVVAIGQHRSG